MRSKLQETMAGVGRVLASCTYIRRVHYPVRSGLLFFFFFFFARCGVSPNVSLASLRAARFSDLIC